MAEAEAVLVDLLLGCGPARGREEARDDHDHDPPRHVFVLSAEPARDGSAAERLYRIKEDLDRLDLSAVRVLTCTRGRALLQRYRQLLFTELYRFEYRLHEHRRTCAARGGPAHRGSPEEGEGAESVEQEVQRFVQGLPGLGGDVSVWRSSLIPGCFGHGFSTRWGGVSAAPTLSALNLFCSQRRRDPVAVVTENRRRLAVHAGFHPRPLRLVKVNHADEVWVLGEAEPVRYDAMVTDQAGVVLAAPGADCMPLLFCDPVRKVIGVAHAGWKGTLMGVATRTLNAMTAAFGCRAGDVAVAVGPSVGACCFTLEPDEARGFSRIHPDCVPDPEAPRPHVDIRLANRILLQEGGVPPENIHDEPAPERGGVTPCTSCHPQLFYSHVRDGADFGTQVGFLWIREEAEPAAPSSG